MPKAPAAYYSEIDPKAAATLRELIKYGIIADGDVDERSIEDVTPIELAGYTQRHFFAGFGVWSYALRNAGWPDSRPVVTGSCPCQPFSAAGKGEGFTDERHLWPALFWHIRFGRPCPVFGEQVASSDGLTWLDSVSADLEATSHTIAAVDLCSAGFGSPNIRQRLYWMAHPELSSSARYGRDSGKIQAEGRVRSGSSDSGILDGLAHTPGQRQPGRWIGVRGTVACDQRDSTLGSDGGSETPELRTSDGLGDTPGSGLQERLDDQGGSGGAPGAPEREVSIGGSLVAGGLGDTSSGGRGELRDEALAGSSGYPDGADGPSLGLAYADGGESGDGRVQRSGEHGLVAEDGGAPIGMADAWDGQLPEQGRGSEGRDGTRPTGPVHLGGSPGPTNGFWRDADWLFCRDGRWRPVRSGSSPLAHGAPERMGRLRGYGNAINAEVAKGFIEACIAELFPVSGNGSFEG